MDVVYRFPSSTNASLFVRFAEDNAINVTLTPLGDISVTHPTQEALWALADLGAYEIYPVHKQ